MDASAPNNIVPFPTTQSSGSARATQAQQTRQTQNTATQPPAALASVAASAAPQQSQPPDVAALEREVRADPVIQELIRMGGTELAEVRPLDDSEHS
jgi:hypothetical protein